MAVPGISKGLEGNRRLVKRMIQSNLIETRVALAIFMILITLSPKKGIHFLGKCGKSVK